MADAIALTPMAAAFRKTAIEESKRLLYVSMTRARDLLVLARSSRKLTGEWLDCVEGARGCLRKTEACDRAALWLALRQTAGCLTRPTGRITSKARQEPCIGSKMQVTP